MRVLLIHSDYLKYQTKSKTRIAEEIEEDKKSGSFQESLVVLSVNYATYHPLRHCMAAMFDGRKKAPFSEESFGGAPSSIRKSLPSGMTWRIRCDSGCRPAKRASWWCPTVWTFVFGPPKRGCLQKKTSLSSAILSPQKWSMWSFAHSVHWTRQRSGCVW